MNIDSENSTPNDFYVKETYKQGGYPGEAKGLWGKGVFRPLGMLGEG